MRSKLKTLYTYIHHIKALMYSSTIVGKIWVGRKEGRMRLEDGKRSSNVRTCLARGRVRWCGPERPVRMCDDMKEHCEGVNGTCAAKRCEHVFGKIKDVVCVAVVHVEENLNMFPGCLYSVGMGDSPRTMFEYRADCNRDIASTLT
jgi:hypothetical protein